MKLEKIKKVAKWVQYGTRCDGCLKETEEINPNWISMYVETLGDYDTNQDYCSWKCFYTHLTKLYEILKKPHSSEDVMTKFSIHFLPERTQEFLDINETCKISENLSSSQ